MVFPLGSLGRWDDLLALNKQIECDSREPSPDGLMDGVYGINHLPADKIDRSHPIPTVLANVRVTLMLAPLTRPVHILPAVSSGCRR